jgi:hypothetical protein
MRIPVREVLFSGQDRCPEFDCSQEPLPKELDVLLCLLEGAERRREIRAKLDGLPSLEARTGHANAPAAAKR